MADRYWVSPNTIVQFSVAAQEAATEGLFFKPDGTKMYVVGSSGDDVNEYDLSAAWDISTASYLQNFSVAAQETAPRGLFFNPDGLKMYVIGDTGNDVNEYDLSTAWDISTASYLQNFSVSAQETSPQDLFFKPDGTKMYIVGLAGDDINEYDLSSAWDISTSVYLQNFSVAAQETAPTGIYFRSDGLKMYLTGYGTDRVYEYNLSSAWDISTASFLQFVSISAQTTDPITLFFKPDGTKMYVAGQNNNLIFQYPISTAWNISTITIDTWDGTAGSKWALTSGGTGGETIPTTADDVYFDANSSGIVTIATGNTGAGSLNCTGFVGTITGSSNITVAGSITLSAGMTFTYGGTVTISGTGTLITAGKQFSPLFINGSGITVTLGDAANLLNRSFGLNQGTFDTAGYNLTVASIGSNNSNLRALNLNASTVTLSGNIDFVNSNNFTFNAGTSQINLNAGNAVFNGGSQTFYNVTFIANGGTRSISGANTFNDLTFNAIYTGLFPLSLAANQTVNGTLSCTGASAIQRPFIFSNTLGTTRTITAAAVSATDCDFRDITIDGAAAPISPTRAGDCGGNSGITFPAAKDCYRVGTNTTWNGSSSWALTSGGSGSDNNFPLAQDTAIINEDTTLTGTLTTTIYNIGSIDASARTTGITFNQNTGATIYGNYTLGSGVTVSGANIQTFSGRDTQTFTSAGKTITFVLYVEKPAGAFELGDAFNCQESITVFRGTFDAKTYNLTCRRFTFSADGTTALNMGSGLWTLSGTGNVWALPLVSFTFNKGTADILLSDTSASTRTFNAGGYSYNKLTVGGATGTSILTITAGAFTELASTKTVAHTVRFSASSVVTIDTWSVTGTSGNLVTVDSSSAGTRRTVTLTNSTAGLIDYLSVKDIGITSPNRFFVGDNSTDGGNNLNVYFTSFPALDTGNMLFMFH
jgi:6-phosphogluconolactonase (cycloisomerase 2 family)